MPIIEVPVSQKLANLLPDGTYQAVIVDAQLANAPTGTPFLALTAVVTAGEHRKKTALAQLYLTPAAAWKFDQLHNAIGLQTAGKVDTAMYLDKPVTIRTKQFRGIDDPFAEIVRFARPKGGAQ